MSEHEPTMSERLRKIDVMDDPLSAGIAMIEAADLIDALVEALEWMNRLGGLGIEVHERIDAVLARAKGESHG